VIPSAPSPPPTPLKSSRTFTTINRRRGFQSATPYYWFGLNRSRGFAWSAHSKPSASRGETVKLNSFVSSAIPLRNLPQAKHANSFRVSCWYENSRKAVRLCKSSLRLEALGLIAQKDERSVHARSKKFLIFFPPRGGGPPAPGTAGAPAGCHREPSACRHPSFSTGTGKAGCGKQLAQAGVSARRSALGCPARPCLVCSLNPCLVCNRPCLGPHGDDAGEASGTSLMRVMISLRNSAWTR
jgi:hypothetical protein